MFHFKSNQKEVQSDRFGNTGIFLKVVTTCWQYMKLDFPKRTWVQTNSKRFSV